MKRNRCIWHITKTIVILCVVFCYCGCNPAVKKRSAECNATPVNINLEIDKPSIPLSTVFNKLRLIKLETTANSLIGDISRVYIKSDTLYMTDGLSIYVFTMDGHLVRKIWHRGNGPYEYTNISDFQFDTKSRHFEVLNRGLRKIVIYDAKGTAQAEYGIDRWANSLATLNNNLRVVYSGNEIEEGNSHKLTMLNGFTKQEAYLPINASRAAYLHVRGVSNFYRIKDTLLFYEPFNDTIYSISPSGIGKRYVVGINPEKIIPNTFFQKGYRYIFEFFNDLKRTHYAYGILGLIETKNSLLFSYNVCMGDSIAPVFVHYNKCNGASIAFRTLHDDLASHWVDFDLARFNMFPQDNGKAILVIPAHEFVSLFSQAILPSGRMDENKTPAELKYLVNSTKVNDNPILCLLDIE